MTPKRHDGPEHGSHRPARRRRLLRGALNAAELGFALVTPVAWAAVAVVAPASMVGGEVGARLARRMSERTLRVGIVAYGVACAVWLFMR